MPDEILRRLAVWSCKLFMEIITYEDSLIEQLRANKVWFEGFHSHSLYDPNHFSLTCARATSHLFEKLELLVKIHSFSYPKL